MSRKALALRLMVMVGVLSLALTVLAGQARATLGPAYNAYWPRGDCDSNSIRLVHPTQVRDLGLYHRIGWTTILWRASNGVWTPAVAGRDYVKNVGPGVYRYGWAYRMGVPPNSVGSYYPDIPSEEDKYTIINPGRYAVMGWTYYYAVSDWRAQDLELIVSDGWNEHYATACTFG